MDMGTIWNDVSCSLIVIVDRCGYSQSYIVLVTHGFVYSWVKIGPLQISCGKKLEPRLGFITFQMFQLKLHEVFRP